MCYHEIIPIKAGDKMSTKAELKDRLRKAMDLREKKAVDLTKDLKIPKSAVSQYLSGYRTIKDSKRLYIIAEYLDVNEAWLMGFDVPMERRPKKNEELTDEQIEKSANMLADLFLSIGLNEEENMEFMTMVEEYAQLPATKKAQVREYVHLLSGKD